MAHADEAVPTRQRPPVPAIPRGLLGELAYSLGEAGARRWVAQAVEVARDLMAAWDLVPVEVLSGGSMSLCVKCRDAEGAPVVLKVPAGVPGGRAERAALRVWAGSGAARLLAEDESTSSMLMRFVGRVGVGSYGLTDVLDLADRLHAADPAGQRFDPVEVNLAHRVACARERFVAAADEQNLRDLDRAQALLADLLAAPAHRVLLHGDLQAKNLILGPAGLTAVDPLPVLGPAVFDVAFWIAKSVHVHPVATYVDQVVRMRPGADRAVLEAWTWALAVLENRPHVRAGREQRQEYIDGLRPR